jgi:DnaJ-class molecular chaperone
MAVNKLPQTQEEMDLFLDDVFRTVFKREDLNKTCPECNGSGKLEYEIPIVDYANGGYLYTEWGTCENCGGTGEIEDWQYEGETDAND